MGTRELHYLQSLTDRSGEHLPSASDAGLGILLEVTLAVALGREIVVPQADAFRSLGFLRVAKHVLAARDEVGSTVMPFRLYRPNVSEVGRLRDSGEIDGERAELLTVVQRELADRPVVVGRPWVVQPLLNELVLDLVTTAPGMSKLVAASAVPVLEVWQELRSAAHMLDPRRTGAFDRRDALHTGALWPGDPDGRPPVEIVGAERLELLREYLDTAAAQLMAGSIGGDLHATFTTGLRRTTSRLAIAQALALSGYQLKIGGRPQPIRSSAEPDTGILLVGDNHAVRSAILTHLPTLFSHPPTTRHLTIGPTSAPILATVTWPDSTLAIHGTGPTREHPLHATTRSLDLTTQLNQLPRATA